MDCRASLAMTEEAHTFRVIASEARQSSNNEPQITMKNYFINPFSWFKNALNQNLLMSKYNIYVLGIVGSFGHPFYWIWWTYFDPQPHENIVLRIIGTFSCLLLFTIKYWPKSLQKIVPAYWFLTVMYNFTFFFTVYLITSKFSVIWSIAEVVMVLFTSTVITGYILLIINLSIGISLAIAYCLFIAPELVYFDQYLMLYIYFPTCAFAFVTGLLLNYSNIKGLIELERKTSKSIAGSIAHELRNPLNAINLAQNQAGELLSESTDKDINQNIKQQLTDINSSISSSVTEANNTINIILADLGNKPIEPSDFSYLSAGKILPEIIKTFGYRNLEEKEKVKLNVKDNFIFKAIDDRFTFIIYNLLKNALYYLNQYPASIVTVGAETRSVDNKEYNSIYVYDTGPGIPSEILPKLFGDFFTSGKKDGTGLGLAFCKRNMKIFGGDIVVESELGKDGPDGKKNGWTKFSLLFPKLSEDEIVRAETEAKKRKILLVDDQQVNLLTTKSRIEQNLANVICDLANNGKEAINLTKENKYSLILMDIQMPEMDGIEAAKNIRKFNKEAPIIAYTSLDHDLEKIKAATNDLLKKPVAENILFRTISKWITDYKDEFSYLGTKEEYKIALQNKNILLADDQQMNLMMTKRSLENYGLKVTAVKDGKELLEIYHSNPHSFDLIITDINMPPHNGDEAAKEIRKTNQNIPIIALSGDGEKKDIYHFFNSGMNDYFIKGGNPELLIKIVANYLIEKKVEQKDQMQDLGQEPGQDQILKTQNNDFVSLKIFNLDNINFLDQESRKSILDLFLRSSKELLDQIKQNKEINNLKDLSFQIHSLKGISGNIGAERLFEYTKNLDLDIKHGKIPENKNWFEQLELMYKELVEEIKSLV